MFIWYRDAQICYAYLQDVDSGEDYGNSSSSFSRSRWFTRGWTLQELIAPSKLVFLGSDWREIGSRSKLVETIAQVTGIDAFLFQHGVLGRYSIAQRMSWASKRQTTRVEDQAYCLLGIFGVNMPLLYGEGTRAFVRLQEEIMKQSDDHSIFAWSSTTGTQSGLLASSPSDFQASGKVTKVALDRPNPPYSATNRGIQITLPIIEPDSAYSLPFIPYEGALNRGSNGVQFAFTPTSTLAILNCQSLNSEGSRIGIYLERRDALQPYHRSDHSLGLISLPVSEINKHARSETVIIRAQDANDDKPLWSVTNRKMLVIVKSLPVPSLDQSFVLRKTLPEKSQWVKQESGLLSVRLGMETFSERAGLLFENDAGWAFCVFFEPTKDAVLTHVAMNLRDSDAQSVINDVFYDKNGVFQRHSFIQKTQIAGDKKVVTVSVETRMRHHGALVWIGIRG